MQKNVMPVRMFKLLQSPEASYKQYQISVITVGILHR